MTTVFLSAGASANAEAAAFADAVRTRLRAAGLEPRTVGEDYWDNSRPLHGASKLMALCHGAVILALERYYFESGFENRGEGGRDEVRLGETLMPTVWNQIEGTMAYVRGIPLLVISDQALLRDGLLEDGYDWYVLKVDCTPECLASPEFNGVFESWRRQVEKYEHKLDPPASKTMDPATRSVGELIAELKPSQLWAVLTALAGALAAAFALGAKLI